MWFCLGEGHGKRTNNAKRDDPVGVEDVGYAQRKAKDYTQHSGPADELVWHAASSGYVHSNWCD